MLSVSMLNCSVGRVYNIASYCHLVWLSSTTTFYPPVGSQCQYVNMHGTPSKKLHSKSKIIQFLFFVHYCKKSWHQKKKSCKGQHQTKNIYISHDRIKCPPRFTRSVSNTGVVGKKVELEERSVTVYNTQDHLCTLEESGSWCLYGGAVQWSFRLPEQIQCSPEVMANLVRTSQIGLTTK